MAAFVLLQRYADPHAMRADVAVLKDAGIVVQPRGLEAGSMLPDLGRLIGLELHVPAADLERAQELLEAVRGAPDEPPDDGLAGPDEPIAPPRPPFVLQWVFVGLATAKAGAGRWGLLPAAAHAGLWTVFALWNKHVLLLWPVLWLLDGWASMLWQRPDPPAHRLPTAAERRTRPLRRALPLACLLLVALPLGLQKLAPAVYLGADGVALCERSDACGIEAKDECLAGAADHLAAGNMDWGRLVECRACAQDKRCEAIWIELPCSQIRIYDAGPDACVDGTFLALDACQQECAGALAGSVPARLSFPRLPPFPSQRRRPW